MMKCNYRKYIELQDLGKDMPGAYFLAIMREK